MPLKPDAWSLKPDGFLRARNADTGGVIASRVQVAHTRAARAIGLLARRALGDDEGLWIVPCRGVHTCGMRFPIDLVALDGGGVVVDRVTALRPWRIRLPRRGVVGVLELVVGALDRSSTRLGHRVVLENVEDSRHPWHRSDTCEEEPRRHEGTKEVARVSCCDHRNEPSMLLRVFVPSWPVAWIRCGIRLETRAKRGRT